MGLLNQWETILKSSTGPPTNQGRWTPNSPLQSFTAPGREAARINSGDGMGWQESNPKKSEVCLMIVFSETHGNMKLGSFQISKWKNLTHHHGEATLRFGKLPWKEVPWKELPWNHLALDNRIFFWIPLHATHHNKWFFSFSCTVNRSFPDFAHAAAQQCHCTMQFFKHCETTRMEILLYKIYFCSIRNGNEHNFWWFYSILICASNFE